VPYGWLLLFFLLPFLILAKISVSEMENVVFKDLITYKDGLLQLSVKLATTSSSPQDALYSRPTWPA
jgi:putrescine transport system permease protein